MTHPYKQPLTFSSSMLRAAMKSLRFAIREIQLSNIIKDSRCGGAFGSLMHAFGKQLDAWTYLHGYGAELFPTEAERQRLVNRLLSLDLEGFDEWLSRIEAEGFISMSKYTV